MVKASALILGGAVAWIILSAGQAGAFTLSDQSSKTTNSGTAVANTGGNGAVGNASTNDANSNQTAKASGGSKNSVAVNDGGASNSSDGSASIHTGDATATGNKSDTSTTQAVASDGKGLVLADQRDTTSNSGKAVANTGDNFAVGNASTNDADLNQKATATGGKNAIAVNSGDSSNKSNGSADIVTGNADATGNDSSTRSVQVVDANNVKSFVLADQTQNTTNKGSALASSGFNFASGNLATDDNDVNQTANASGSKNNIAVNTGGASNNSDGSAAIDTGNATATGSQANNDSAQILNAAAVAPRNGSASAVPLALLLGLCFIARPARRMALRATR